jgi:hydroxylaminobenzene mutase
MTTTDRRRRLVWHGVLLFFLSLVEGLFVYGMRNPRMGVAAHTGGLVSGLFIAIVGLAWSELRLSDRWHVATYWLTLVGAYGGTLFLLVAALLGTSAATPIAGAGHAAPAWQESLVTVGLSATGVAILVACVLLLWGLRGRAEGQRSGARIA